MSADLRLGRICYINVLPIYYAIMQAYVPNGFEMVSGTPAELNALLFNGALDVSAISSVEYGRHFRDYLLLPDLSISTAGDVGSVLFFSRVPFHRLSGREVLLSDSSATSAALVKIILYELYGARPFYRIGTVGDSLPDGCYGLLAIGDEALRLRALSRYPYFLDLGRAWHRLTGLPFVFGVWAVRRAFYSQHPEEVHSAHRILLQARDWGLKSLEEICGFAARAVNLDTDQLLHYFQQLNYTLDANQQKGLAAFYRYLHRYRALPELPVLEFI